MQLILLKTIESHQHRKIACLEEIAYLNGWISREKVLAVYEVLKKNQYGQYLKDILDGKYIDTCPLKSCFAREEHRNDNHCYRRRRIYWQ